MRNNILHTINLLKIEVICTLNFKKFGQLNEVNFYFVSF